MGSQKIHTVPYRRKRENKTDYKARLSLIKSKKARFVVRKSMKHLTIQIVQYVAGGDKILATISTSALTKLGWKHSTSNIPSAYLAGLLSGNKAKELKVTEGVLDIGLSPSIKGSRLYAALKGIVDAGVAIPASEEIFPQEERLNGKHIADFKKIEGFEKDVADMKNKILA